MRIVAVGSASWSPSRKMIVEPEFVAYAPKGVAVSAAQMSLESVIVKERDTMSDDADRAVQLLGDADVDSVAYANTPESLLHGPGFDRDLEATLR